MWGPPPRPSDPPCSAARIVVHPSYNANSMINDVALIELTADVPASLAPALLNANSGETAGLPEASGAVTARAGLLFVDGAVW